MEYSYGEHSRFHALMEMERIEIGINLKVLPSPSIHFSSSPPAPFYCCSSPLFPLFSTTSPGPLSSG